MKEVTEDNERDAELVWGAAAIGKIINRSSTQVYHLNAGGHLGDAVKQVGRLLAGNRSKLKALV
jgi:hypothetical protein